MKIFKKLSLIIFLIIPFLANGCYTVLWTPDEDFPNESNYEYYDTYYSDEYIYFYDYPWWLSFTPTYKYRTDDNSYERDNSTNSIRNNGNGRGDSGREILVTPPPTKNSIPRDNGSDNSSGNNNNTSTETKRTETDNSNSSNNNSRQDSNSNNSSVRNNDGNRNSGKGR